MADRTPIKDPPPVEIGMIYPIKITSVTTARSFAVQVDDRIQTVDYIQKIAQEFGDNAPKLKNVKSGDVCIGRYIGDDGDGLWYRVSILEVDEERGVAEVYFTDFGNIDDCQLATDIRACPARISKFLPQVIECQWVHASPNPEIMQDVIKELVRLSESEILISATVVAIESVYPGSMQLNFGYQDGPVVLDIPVLDGFKKKTVPALAVAEGLQNVGSNSNQGISNANQAQAIEGETRETVLIDDDDGEDDEVQFSFRRAGKEQIGAVKMNPLRSSGQEVQVKKVGVTAIQQRAQASASSTFAQHPQASWTPAWQTNAQAGRRPGLGRGEYRRRIAGEYGNGNALPTVFNSPVDEVKQIRPVRPSDPIIDTEELNEICNAQVGQGIGPDLRVTTQSGPTIPSSATEDKVQQIWPFPAEDTYDSNDVTAGTSTNTNSMVDPVQMAVTSDWMKRIDEMAAAVDVLKASVQILMAEKGKAAPVAQVVSPTTPEAENLKDNQLVDRLLEIVGEKVNIIKELNRKHEVEVKELRKLLLVKGDKLSRKDYILNMAVEEADRLRQLLKDKEKWLESLGK